MKDVEKLQKTVNQGIISCLCETCKFNGGKMPNPDKESRIKSDYIYICYGIHSQHKMGQGFFAQHCQGWWMK